VATELTSQKRLGPVLFYGIVALLVYLAFQVFAPFLVPLAWAAVLVIVSYPAYEWVSHKWGPTRGAIVCTLAVTLILIVPVLFLMVAFVRQGVSAVQEIQFQLAIGSYTKLDDLWTKIQERFPEAGGDSLSSTLQQYGAVAAGFVAGKLGVILKNAAVFFFHLGVTVLAMFYFYRDGASMVARLRQLLPFELAHRDRMLSESRELIFASVTSSLAAAVAHAILGGVAFAVTGIQAPIFWGVMMGFFSFVPLVGSALIWVPVAISLMAGGHLGRGIALVFICAVIVGAVDNVIRPWLISGRAELGGLMVFIGVLGGIEAFGLLGVVLGPIIVAMAAGVLEVYAPPHAPGGNKAARADAN
jgi:predicted PurR-regulated permease PerM